MNLTDALILRTLGAFGSGTVSAVRYTPQLLTAAQRQQARTNLGVDAGEQIVEIQSEAPTLNAEDRTLYLCRTPVSSLTLSGLPAEGLFEIVFASGAAAAEIVLPSSVLLPEDAVVESDMIHDLSVRVCSIGGQSLGLAALGSWPAPEAAEEPTV